VTPDGQYLAGRAVESVRHEAPNNQQAASPPLLPSRSARGFIWPYVSRERRRLRMLATKVMTPKEHVDGYYKVTQTPWATDYVWVPAEEEVEGRLLDEVLHPWQAAYAEWVKQERIHPEEQARMEMEAL